MRREGQSVEIFASPTEGGWLRESAPSQWPGKDISCSWPIHRQPEELNPQAVELIRKADKQGSRILLALFS